MPEWEDILNENPGLSIFSTPEWLGSWWEAFGQRGQLTTLGFFDAQGKLLGLIPLYEEPPQSRFTRLRRLRFVGDGSGDSDNLELILRTGFERECCRAFIQWLANRRCWDVCSLNTMPSGASSTRALLQELAAAQWPSRVTETASAAIPLPPDWPSYVESLEGNFRPLVTRYPQRLARRFHSRIHCCESPLRLSEALDHFFALHQKRWTRVHEPGSFRSYERRQFYRRMSKAFLKKGWLEFWLLELDGNTVAAQFCFRYRQTAYLLQEGFDPDFAAQKVGYALRAAMLKHFIDSGFKRYDFLGGMNDHKRKWGALPGEYQNLQFALPRSPGSRRLAFEEWACGSKARLRRCLPPPIWKLLHHVKLSITGPGSQLAED